MKLLVLSLVLYLPVICFSQTIAGKVLDTDTQKPLPGTNVFLAEQKVTEDTVNVCYWRMDKYKIISAAKTDSAGEFKFTGMPGDIYSVVVEYEMPPIEKFGGAFGVRNDIDSNITIKPAGRHYKIFSLMVTCPYDKTKNQLSCPVCKKKDMVKEYLFGLPIYDEHGEIDDKYYLGGCFVDSYCSPARHCLRCNKDF